MEYVYCVYGMRSDTIQRFEITRKTEKTIWFKYGPTCTESSVLVSQLGKDVGKSRWESKRFYYNDESTELRYRLKEKFKSFVSKLDQLKELRSGENESVWDTVLAIELK